MGIFAKSDPEKDTQIMLGDPKVAIFTMVVPFLISLIMNQINMLADVAWCSGMGSEQVSAIQTVTPIYWVIFDVGLGIGLGCNVLIARRIGAGDRAGAQNIIAQGLVVSLIIALLLAPVLYLMIAPMVSWMGAESLTELSVAYLTPILICNVFQVLSPTLSGFLRGEGAAKRSNFALILGTLANIILDPILIYGLELGVLGAGIATAVACVVSSIVMIYYYVSGSTTLRMSLKGYRFQTSEVKEIMYIGLPKMAEMFLMDTMDAFNRVFLIQCGGVDAVTLFTIPFRWVILAVMIPNSFSLSLTPVSSANIGAKRPDKSVRGFKICVKASLITTAVMVVAYLIFAEFLIIPFIQSETMIVLKSELIDILRIETLLIPALGLTFVCNSMLQSMRKPMVALFITFIKNIGTTAIFFVLCDTSVDIMVSGMVVATYISAVICILLTRVAIKEMMIGFKAPSPA